MEGELTGDEVKSVRSEGQRLGIRLNKRRMAQPHGVGERVGFGQHALVKVDPNDLPGPSGKRSGQKPCPTRHVQDAHPWRWTGQTHDALQQLLVRHGAAWQVVRDLAVELCAHMRLHRC